MGLAVDAEPPHVWHQEFVVPGHLPGYDGVVNDYFLVRTAAFIPRGTMSDEQLAAENISEFRWWPLSDIVAYRGSDLFGPRDLAELLAALVAGGVPPRPVRIGL